MKCSCGYEFENEGKYKDALKGFTCPRCGARVLVTPKKKSTKKKKDKVDKEEEIQLEEIKENASIN